MKSTENSLVTVIITVYNDQEYLEEAISSVLEQTHGKLQVIIIDDGSTDGTKEVLSGISDSRVEVYYNETNMHYLRCRNIAFKKAKGEFLTFCDSDDVMYPEKIEQQLDFLSENIEYGFCATNVLYIDNLGKDIGLKPLVASSDQELREAVGQFNPLTGPTIMIRRSVVVWDSLYRDYFNGIGNEDYDLLSRLLDVSKGIILETPLYRYRQYPNSTSRRDFGVDIHKTCSYQLVQKFIKQRQVNGVDCLELGDYPAVNALVSEIASQYFSPSPRLALWRAEGSIYVGQLYEALKFCLKGVLTIRVDRVLMAKSWEIIKTMVKKRI